MCAIDKFFCVMGVTVGEQNFLGGVITEPLEFSLPIYAGRRTCILSRSLPGPCSGL